MASALLLSRYYAIFKKLDQFEINAAFLQVYVVRNVIDEYETESVPTSCTSTLS